MTLNISATDSQTGVRDMRFKNTPSTPALVLQDSYPWGLDSIQQVLIANNIPYDQLTSSAIPTVNLGLYSMVIIPSVQGDAFCNTYNANLSKFASYVQSGGVLELHGATYSSDTCRPMLPGGGTNSQNLQDYNYVVSPTHPLMVGVPNPFYGNSASHNSFTGYPAKTSILATAGSTPGGNPTLIEYPYGLGKVVASGQTLEWGRAHGQAAGRILVNAIPYAAGYRPWATTFPWVLSSPDGAKIVYGEFRNNVIMRSLVYTATIVLDTVAPASSASSPAYRKAAPVAVMWTASDALSGVSSTALWVKFGSGGTWVNTGLTQAGTSGTFNYTPGSGEGAYYFATVAADNAGNVEATPTSSGDTSTIYDITPPESHATVPALSSGDVISVTWEANDATSGVSFTTLWAKFGSSGTWASSGLTQTGTSGAFNYALSQGRGIYYFATVAADRAGNVESGPSGDGDGSVVNFHQVFLPVTLRNWPPLPAIPTLNPISNPNGVGNYTVSWSSAEFADSYILEEAKYSTFAGALQVYSGVGTSYPVSGRGAARYYYHVKAHNSYGDSAWSAVRSVDVLWEAEPNNDGLEANGPLVSGLTYFGTFPDSGDTKDYFYIELSAAHTIEVWLTNIPAGQNYDLALRDTSLNAIKWSVNGGNADEYISSGVLSPGKYYVQVYHASPGGSSQPYHLVVVYQ